MKDSNLNIRISQSERESLAEKAKQKGVTVSNLIRSTLQLADPLETVLRRMPINDRQRKYCRLWITDYENLPLDEIETTVNRTLLKYNSDADFFKGGNMDYRLKKNNPLLSEDDPDAAQEAKVNDALANADENTDMTKAVNNPLLENDLEDD